MKKYQEAVLELKRVIRIAPNNADVYHNLGQIFEKTKDYQDAINTYQEFLKIKGADWENKDQIESKIKYLQDSLKIKKAKLSEIPDDKNVMNKLKRLFK